MSKLAVIYYSATGHGTSMAKRVAAAAEAAGAEVRVRHIAETREPESFAQNPAWTANYEAHKDLPSATGDDIVWADAVIFGSPTRFGSVAPHSSAAFIDSLGRLWAQGKLADKVYAAFTSTEYRPRRPGDHAANLYISLMHFGGIIVPPGYTDDAEVRGRKPLRRGPDRRPRQHQRVRRQNEQRARPLGQARRRGHRPPHQLAVTPSR